jgi:hypothetical protein
MTAKRFKINRQALFVVKRLLNICSEQFDAVTYGSKNKDVRRIRIGLEAAQSAMFDLLKRQA